MYPKELEVGVQTSLIPIFIVALFIIAKRWRQPKYSS
jgi:hypothetical protein